MFVLDDAFIVDVIVVDGIVDVNVVVDVVYDDFDVIVDGIVDVNIVYYC